MKRAVLALIAIWLWCFSIALAADRPMTRQIVFDGLERSYVVYAPASVSGRRAALVVVLHGQGGDGENALEQGGWVAKARAEGFIVLAPEGTPERADRRPSLLGNRRSWNSGPATGSSAQQRNVDDVGFVRAVIGEVQRTYSVDAGRIYATGFSNGSAMAFRVGAEMSDVVAAIAPVANGLLVPVQRLQQPVSLLMIWGIDDPLNPYAGGSVQRDGQTVVRPSATESWQRWAALLGCSGSPSVDQSIRKVTTRSFSKCNGGSSAVLTAVEGLGHQWPGGRVYVRFVSGPGSNALNATDAIWSFFQGHPR